MPVVAPIPLQQQFWNEWNTATGRTKALDDVSGRQAKIVCDWLLALDRIDLSIIEVGCGAAWFTPQLTHFGRVTATDLADEVLARAKLRLPDAEFVAGDFMSLKFRADYDVAVSLEVLSHVADQQALIAKIACHLRPGGYLMLATQNRPVLQHFNRIAPPAPGQLRHWVDRRELRKLLEPEFKVLKLYSVTCRANRGLMRWIHSRKVNAPLRALMGDRIDRLKEAMGLGWTLMVLARKRWLPTDLGSRPIN
jgi:2-polyprenyl-3-methyl-5-hydroxy-6-metoxy-1,4-benzoquinol methylase